jgi:hypothetical protein
MHGSCYRGDGAAALRALAADYDRRFRATLHGAAVPPAA